jgi:hypothetical protein
MSKATMTPSMQRRLRRRENILKLAASAASADSATTAVQAAPLGSFARKTLARREQKVGSPSSPPASSSSSASRHFRTIDEMSARITAIKNTDDYDNDAGLVAELRYLREAVRQAEAEARAQQQNQQQQQQHQNCGAPGGTTAEANKLNARLRVIKAIDDYDENPTLVAELKLLRAQLASLEQQQQQQSQQQASRRAEEEARRRKMEARIKAIKATDDW